MGEKMKAIDKFGAVATKMGNQIHLRTLRDAFASFMPFMMLAGFVTLINYVILEPTGFMAQLIQPDTLTKWQEIGLSISNGTLNIATLLILVAVSYHLCQNRDYTNYIAAILVSICIFMVVTPTTTLFTSDALVNPVEVTDIIPISHTGASGMFVGIFVGLLATEIFIKLSSNDRLKIKLSGNIPPAVLKSFDVLLPIMITVIIFAFLSFFIAFFFSMNINELISNIIISPLSHITTGLAGFVILTSIANLFFGFGIHQAVISGSLLDPFLLQNMQENMSAYANNQEIPHIINSAFKDTFAVMGGSGNTIALLIAIFIFSRRKDYRDIAKLSLTPALFNISEPIIFGLPIVFNIALIIPFILAPIFSLIVAYFATSVGLIHHVVVQIPWTTPPVLSGFLATAGDWRAAILQIIIIFCSVFIYLPFLKIDEKVANNLAKTEG